MSFQTIIIAGHLGRDPEMRYTPAGLVATSLNPVEIALSDYQTVTGINFGAVVSADLKVSMDASVEKKTILYTIIVTNDGPADALAAVLSGPIPDGTAFV